MSIFKHELGDKARDLVTGFTGIIIARSEHLNGCIRYGLQGPLGKDGKVPESEWFDEKQLEVVRPKVVKIESKRTGGPAPTPKMFSNPR